ncbi:hypothetical protein LJB80_01685, partial [Bacteroides sp. OttesenSCG-928-F21]|nr:hypothetical protein [Bacteroides sp. OttesenSCG-928-F21]
MKIAILTSGILPVPAVQGGAVENLIDFYLEYNEKHKIHHFTVYSVYHPLLKNKKETSHTSYHHIKNDRSFFIRLKRFIFKKTHRNLYYDSSIEFFLYKALQDIKKKEIDAILLENRPGYALSIPKTIKAQLILHLHNDLLNEQTRSSIEMYNNISNIITVSEYIKKQVDGVNKALPSKSITVPNGIDLDKF